MLRHQSEDDGAKQNGIGQKAPEDTCGDGVEAKEDPLYQ